MFLLYKEMVIYIKKYYMNLYTYIYYNIYQKGTLGTTKTIFTG